jgi:aspartate racemase
MKTLGLIGGMSWVSTIEYYRGINERVNERLGGAQYPRCIIHSMNFADMQDFNDRRDWDGFLEMTSGIGRDLRNAGAEGIVLCANTAHIVAERLQDRVGLPVIHIADATADAVTAAGLNAVGLLGTRFTMELDFFKERLARRGIEALIPSDGDRAFIHESIFTELGRGVLRDETRARYIDVMSRLAADGAQGVILGCTEIPLLVKQEHASLPLFDTTSIHVGAAVEFILA